jgi:hypothetical protein
MLTPVTCASLSALGGTRTPNLLIRSQMLYPLSYERRDESVYAGDGSGRRCDEAEVSPLAHVVGRGRVRLVGRPPVTGGVLHEAR